MITGISCTWMPNARPFVREVGALQSDQREPNDLNFSRGRSYSQWEARVMVLSPRTFLAFPDRI